MKKMWSFRSRSKRRRAESKRFLIENNNNDIQDGYDLADNGYTNAAVQNSLNTHEEQRLQSAAELSLLELAEFLGVAPDVNTSEAGSCCSVIDLGQQSLKQSAVRLIQRSVSQHFPKPPADLDQNLLQHLLNVQETVRNELVKLRPLLDRMELMGCLTDCYHRQTFDHLIGLLQNIRSSQNSFVLMKWVLHAYLSQELLCHPDLQEVDPIKKVDLLLFTECVATAKDKLLENVQKELRGSLEKILQIERSQEGFDQEEACVGLYVDTIQCIDAMPKEAQKISSKLSVDVREVCFQELLKFVLRYTTEQKEILGKKAKMDEPEMIHFIKTLKTCKELKQHVQTKSKGIERSLLQETVAALENMEAFTLKLVKKIVADIAEKHLKTYFKAQSKQFFLLIQVLQTHFPKLRWCQDVQKRVMDETYKLIVHIYLKHLVRSSQSKLTKRWSPDVGQTVAEDAKLLHLSIADLAPGVQQWNLMLLTITELLECKGTDEVKLTVASVQKECLTWSEDQDLLPALLRWQGLSGWQVREVLDALPTQQTIPRSVSWCSGLTCW